MSFSPLKQENEQLSSYKDSSPWTSFFITEEQAQTLLKTAIPITLPYTDLQGRTIQLWKYVNLFVASIKQNGLIAIFSGNKIHNALLPEESSALLLKRLENNPLKKWHFSYLKDTGKFFIWPFLIGGGIDKYELAYNAALNLEHKKNKTPTEEHLLAIVDGNLRKECELIGAKREARNEPLMRDGKPLLRKKDGKPYNHIKETNNSQHGIKNIIKYDLRPQLRRDPPLSPAEKKQVQKEISMCSLILEYSERFHPSKPMKKVLEEAAKETAENTAAKKNQKKSSKNISKKSPQNPPKNNPPKNNPPNPPKNPPPNLQKESFKDRVQANRLVGSYNSCHPDHPMEEGGSSGGHIGGVGNEIGIILGLFDDVSGMIDREHTFFLPVLDKLSLNQEEVQRMLHELAMGIFVHDTVPFFSLHFNGDTNMYPVIHPVYQNTFVGHVISMLDYHMKGFLNGGFFPAAFVQEWNQNPHMSEEALQEQIIDVREYCQKHLGPNYRYLSVRELTEAFELKEALEPVTRSVEEHPILRTRLHSY